MGRQPVFHVVLALGSSDPPTDSNDTIRPAASESKLKISNPNINSKSLEDWGEGEALFPNMHPVINF